MKKIALSLILVSGLGFLTSCASTWPVAGATGKVGSKVGESAATSVFYMPATGDAGIVAAAKKAGITTIGTVDQKVSWWIFGTTYTTIVTGE